jgi:hypothetical protein
LWRRVDSYIAYQPGFSPVSFSETSVSTYESTRHHNPEEHRHLHCNENPRSLIYNYVYITQTYLKSQRRLK